VILFSGQPSGGLSRIASTGGAVTPATELDASRHQTSHRWPSFLPDGRHFVYTSLAEVSTTTADGVFVGALGSNQARHLVDVRSNASYASPGYLLFAREGALVAQPFDAAQQKLTGDAVNLADEVQAFPTASLAAFSVSENGLLAYQTAAAEVSQLVWFDRAGRQSETGMEAGPIESPKLSHDGRRVAYRVVRKGDRGNIWIYDLASRVSNPFTFGPADDFSPVWSPDDGHIVFSSNRSGLSDLYINAVSSGTGAAELLYSSEARKAATDWSRDGRLVLFIDYGAGSLTDIWSLSLPDRKAKVVLQTEFFETSAQLSPDGRWMAYTSDESGRNQVYVQPFPGPGPKWRLSRDGGNWPRWRGDGKEIFFVREDRVLMAVELRAGETSARDPKPLFTTRLKGGATIGRQYDVTPDGQRFLVNNALGEESASITLVQNWAADLKR
jgi:hypothetical protein